MYPIFRMSASNGFRYGGLPTIIIVLKYAVFTHPMNKIFGTNKENKTVGTPTDPSNSLSDMKDSSSLFSVTIYYNILVFF